MSQQCKHRLFRPAASRPVTTTTSSEEQVRAAPSSPRHQESGAVGVSCQVESTLVCRHTWDHPTVPSPTTLQHLSFPWGTCCLFVPGF